jgi:hypothetical protein
MKIENMSEQTGIKNENTQFWTSKANLSWIALALLLVAFHLVVRHSFPQFNPPATPNKPSWVRVSLYGELAVHILFLGAVITGITNRIPDLKRPSYSDEGTLRIGSFSDGYTGGGIHWGEIGGILIEFALYLAMWGWIYGII